MNQIKLFLLFTFLMVHAPLHAQEQIYIVIHGTWAAQNPWHKPGGDFFEALADAVVPLHGRVVSFVWSGDNDHLSRLGAAERLAVRIKSYPSSYAVNIVAHSHGANVAILASQLLGQDKNNFRKINKFYALGTPVSVLSYLPDMNVIRNFYNLYSLEDRIQTVFNLFQREFPPHERCANIRLFLNGEEPDHFDLHCPLIAKWLALIHEELATRNIGDFRLFDFELPANIHLFDGRTPLYVVDVDRKEDLEQDFLLSQRLLTAMVIHDRAIT